MPGRGRHWKVGGLKDSTVTSADIKDATIVSADIKIAVSDLQTGNGSAQAFAHGLGVAPTKVICCVYQDANESTPTTVTELVETITDIYGYKPEFKYDLTKPTMIPKRVVDVSKIYEELNWKAKHTLREGLEKTIDWYKESIK